LQDIKKFTSESVKTTSSRIKLLSVKEHADPHVKLLIIDMINFYFGLLNDCDRSTLISELYEQQ